MTAKQETDEVLVDTALNLKNISTVKLAIKSIWISLFPCAAIVLFTSIKKLIGGLLL